MGLTARWVFSRLPQDGELAARSFLVAARRRLGYREASGTPERGRRALVHRYRTSAGVLALNDEDDGEPMALARELSRDGWALSAYAIDSDVIGFHVFVDGAMTRSFDYPGEAAATLLGSLLTEFLPAGGDGVAQVVGSMEAHGDVDDVIFLLRRCFGADDDEHFAQVTFVGGQAWMSPNRSDPPRLQGLRIEKFSGVAGDDFATSSQGLEAFNRGGQMQRLTVEVDDAGERVLDLSWVTVSLGPWEFVPFPLVNGVAEIDIGEVLAQQGIDRERFEQSESQLLRLGFVGRFTKDGTDDIVIRVTDPRVGEIGVFPVRVTAFPAHAVPSRRPHRPSHDGWRHDAMRSIAGDDATSCFIFADKFSGDFLTELLERWARLVFRNGTVERLHIEGSPKLRGVASFRAKDVGTSPRWLALVEQARVTLTTSCAVHQRSLQSVRYPSVPEPRPLFTSHNEERDDLWSTICINVPHTLVPAGDVFADLTGFLDEAARAGEFHQATVTRSGPYYPIIQESRYKSVCRVEGAGHHLEMSLSRHSTVWEPGDTMYVPTEMLERVDHGVVRRTFNTSPLGTRTRLDRRPGATYPDLEVALEPLLFPLAERVEFPPNCGPGARQQMYRLLDQPSPAV